MQHISRASRTIRPCYFRRPFSAVSTLKSTWTPGPSPPRLPKEEQEIFEKLQQQSTGAFSTPKAIQPKAEERDIEAEVLTESVAENEQRSSTAADMLAQLKERARVAADGDGEELHPNVRRGADPEFEGDTNPKTGEVGGPKNEPLRWGINSDWSYNGRVTDF